MAVNTDCGSHHIFPTDLKTKKFWVRFVLGCFSPIDTDGTSMSQIINNLEKLVIVNSAIKILSGHLVPFPVKRGNWNLF